MSVNDTFNVGLYPLYSMYYIGKQCLYNGQVIAPHNNEGIIKGIYQTLSSFIAIGLWQRLSLHLNHSPALGPGCSFQQQLSCVYA